MKPPIGKSPLALGNRAMRRGEYEKAARFYEQAASENTDLAHLVAFNQKVLRKLAGGRDLTPCSVTAQLFENVSRPADEGSLSRQKAAVVVHCYYEDVWDLIKTKLLALQQPLDLFVTIPSNKAGDILPSVLNAFPEARVFLAPNIGMDILPFLSLLPILANEGYTAVCKLHTKLGDTDIDRVWRDLMLDTLIGSAGNFQGAKDMFAARQDVCLIGPAATYQSGMQLLFKNGEMLSELLADAFGKGIPNEQWGFFAGSMFWGRISLLLRLANVAGVGHRSYEAEYRDDGKLEHAIERSFGAGAKLTGGKIGLLHPRSGGHEDCVVGVDETFSLIGRGGIRKVMESLLELGIRASSQDHANQMAKLALPIELFNRLEGLCVDITYFYLTQGRFR